MSYLGAPLMSEKQDWGTPQAFFDYIQHEFQVQFTLDACASAHNHKVENYMTEQDDALTQDWCRNYIDGSQTFEEVWLNPPFGKGGKLQREFLTRASKQAQAGLCRVFALIPARTDTKLFHDVIWREAGAIYFIKGRLNFEHDDRTPRGSAPFPSMLVIFDGYVPGDGPFVSVLTPTKEERGFYGR